MIHALIEGRMLGPALLRSTKKGMRFAHWRMVALDKDGHDVLCACTSFEDPVICEVHRLDDNDRVTVTGKVSLHQWPAHNGTASHELDVKVNRLVSVHSLGAHHAHEPDPTDVEA